MSGARIHVVTVPCFSGAPWDLKNFPGLVTAYEATTLALPEHVDTVEANADEGAQWRNRERVPLLG